MKKTAYRVAVLALAVFFISSHTAHASLVYNGYAGSNSALVTGAKYPGVCFSLPATVEINSITVGLNRTSNAFILDKLIGPGFGTSMWSFGANDTKTVSGTSQTIATTTRTYTLVQGAVYCVLTGTNSGTESFYGSSSDGGELAGSMGATLAEIIANNAGTQVSYFGSPNVWLCDGGESVCGGSAPSSGLQLPSAPTSTSALGAWMSSAVSAFNSVPPWSYWIQLRTVLETDRGLLTSTSSTPLNTFTIGASTTPLHFDITLFTEDQFTTLIPSWLWTIMKTLMASAMWVGFVLMIYHEVDRRFTKPHS